MVCKFKFSILYSFIILVSPLAHSAAKTLSPVPIIQEFGLTLSEDLDLSLIAKELDKKDWVTSSSYKLKIDNEYGFDIFVKVTSKNKIYSIRAFKKLQDCESEFEVIRSNYESKYEITEPQRDFKITNRKTENSSREIKGYCDGRSIAITVSDNLIGKRVIKENNLSYETFKKSLPPCTSAYLKPAIHVWASSLFGERGNPFTGEREWHDEIDFAGSVDQLVYASDGGVVLATSTDDSYGNRVRIKHSNGDITVYSHLNSFLVTMGENVGRGQPIATLGNTGRSTGPHVAFALERLGERIDPLPHMVEKDTCRPIYKELAR